MRGLARRSGMDATYLSRVERGLVPPPTWPKIAALVRHLQGSELARLVEVWGARWMKDAVVQGTIDLQTLLLALPKAAFRDRDWVTKVKGGLEECMMLVNISAGPRRG